MGMGFQFEQHRLGLWDLSWNLKKTISWEMGLGPPPSRPSDIETLRLKFVSVIDDNLTIFQNVHVVELNHVECVT